MTVNYEPAIPSEWEQVSPHHDAKARYSDNQSWDISCLGRHVVDADGTFMWIATSSYNSCIILKALSGTSLGGNLYQMDASF
jgi:hypothetical protein